MHRISGTDSDSIARMELVDSQGYSRAVLAMGDPGTWDQSVESAVKKFQKAVFGA